MFQLSVLLYWRETQKTFIYNLRALTGENLQNRRILSKGKWSEISVITFETNCTRFIIIQR